ncbi:metal-dependent hydrolase [Patescibacteria group bacterium]|nr:metal-dependent hydrolase [Patescibacteria group bacterium]
MDIFAHAIWTSIAAKELNEKRLKEKRNRISIYWSAFWGIFPDLFAFSIPFALFIAGLQNGVSFKIQFHEHGGPGELANILYHYSHSLVIFALVFVLVWLYYKRPRLELLGWMLHILIDIPTHSLKFYPTPFLWPISNYHFPYGVPWSEPWFMLINYSVLLCVLTLTIYRNRISAKF